MCMLVLTMMLISHFAHMDWGNFMKRPGSSEKCPFKHGLILPIGQWYAPSAVINDAWYCLVLHGIALYCIVLHGIAWYCMVLHGIARYCIALHGIAWYCLEYSLGHQHISAESG